MSEMSTGRGRIRLGLSFIQCMLTGAHQVAGTVLGPGDTAMSKTKSPPSRVPS